MVNRAENTIDDRLVNRIAELETAMRELKARQLIGSDGLQVVSSSLLSTGAVVLNPGVDGAKTIIVTFNPIVAKLQLLDVYVSFYIDNDLDINYIYGGGASLSVGQKRFWQSTWKDWGSSNDTTGVRINKSRIRNDDTVDHTIYFYARAYFLKGGGGIT